MAAEPDGRGPMLTISRRWSHALEESKPGAWAAGAPGLTAAPRAACDPPPDPSMQVTPASAARATAAGHAECARRMLASFLARHVVAARRAVVDLARPRDLLVAVAQHLVPLREPAGRARQREQDGEHVEREPHRLID